MTQPPVHRWQGLRSLWRCFRAPDRHGTASGLLYPLHIGGCDVAPAQPDSVTPGLTGSPKGTCSNEAGCAQA
jgi:hypothetical protein